MQYISRRILKVLEIKEYVKSDYIIKSAEVLFRKDSKSYYRRIHCHCCDKIFENNIIVYKAITDKGDQLLCDECVKEIMKIEKE